MESFLALHMDENLHKMKCENVAIKVVKKIKSESENIWTNEFTRDEQQIFCYNMFQLKTRIDAILWRLYLLHQYKIIVQKAKKNNEINYDYLSYLYDCHKDDYISENLEQLFEYLLYGDYDHDDFYIDDYDKQPRSIKLQKLWYIDENDQSDETYENENDLDVDLELTINVNVKKKKERKNDIYKLCLTDIQKEEKSLKFVNNLKKKHYEYCMYAIIPFLNRKMCSDWSLITKVLSYF